MREIPVDVLVIGAGPAGLGTALAAAESGAGEIVLLDRLEEPGGILPQCIHNGFGLRYFGEELTGPEYAERFTDRLERYPQIKLKTQTMVVELAGDRRVMAVSSGDGLVCYRAKAVILAMGCRERPRGALNIPGTRPAGIYTAGMVQRLMNIEGLLPGTRAVILGSGDIGLIMARRLTLEGVKVVAVLEVMPYPGGLTRNVVQCLNDFQIPLLLNHTVIEVFGERRVEGVAVAPVGEDRSPTLEKAFTIDCDTLVLSVGLIPENELSVMAGVEIDPATGGPVVDSNYQTSAPGIFACGNVAHVHDLVDDVSEESRIAGRAAADFVHGKENPVATIIVRRGRNVRSVVPQRIAADQPVTLYIRAGFLEWGNFLRVGNLRVKQKVVTPGETIRFQVQPEEIGEFRDCLPVSLEEGREQHA
jgi:NADPH-dependent 2,4-dienoyl-CoA reductase/sulfur reductase-like enzyme